MNWTADLRPHGAFLPEDSVRSNAKTAARMTSLAGPKLRFSIATRTPVI